jgi:hypothetical protein
MWGLLLFLSSRINMWILPARDMLLCNFFYISFLELSYGLKYLQYITYIYGFPLLCKARVWFNVIPFEKYYEKFSKLYLSWTLCIRVSRSWPSGSFVFLSVSTCYIYCCFSNTLFIRYTFTIISTYAFSADVILLQWKFYLCKGRPISEVVSASSI